ncbi:PEP-CTERM sorting domain-containing protein [Candidatus Kaiserbacteria bacterium]|nr:PEP-CTERM sorting domain-containing protein [Candidatus Kaiserbacteria bacterium]
MFYNTQGRSTVISGGAGDSLSADLWVPADWANAANGARRTDLWGVMTDAADVVSGYPIIGYTNFGNGGFVGFRVWDDSNGVWDNLLNVVNYDAWNTLSFLFTGSAYEYFVNGALAATIVAYTGTQNFDRVIMQAYNFNDPSLSGAVANDYVARWVNTVPEPSTIFLAVAVLGLLGFVRRSSSSFVVAA